MPVVRITGGLPLATQAVGKWATYSFCKGDHSQTGIHVHCTFFACSHTYILHEHNIHTVNYTCVHNILLALTSY